MQCGSIFHAAASDTMPGVAVPAADHSSTLRAHQSRQRRQKTFGLRPTARNAHSASLHSAACASAPAQPSTVADVASMGMHTAAIIPPPASSSGLRELQQQPFSSTAAPHSQLGYVAIEEPSRTEFAPPEAVPALLRASHWITAQRGRSFEDRGLRVRVKVFYFTAVLCPDASTRACLAHCSSISYPPDQHAQPPSPQCAETVLPSGYRRSRWTKLCVRAQSEASVLICSHATNTSRWVLRGCGLSSAELFHADPFS
jgi:hypothetical protein